RGLPGREAPRCVRGVLPKRFGKYGLTPHPDKARLVRFTRPRPGGGPTTTRARGSGPPGPFDSLGFTHFWSRSKKGTWVVKRKTARGRFGRALRRIKHWCRRRRPRTQRGPHEASQLTR